MDNPLVSIVVITYNSSNYVLETLESAKAQTYQNIELIVSDDSSKDNTVDICMEWIEKNKERFVRTELITVKKNTGISSNANRGIKSAKGEWIKGFAGDDILMPNCIETYLSYAKKHSNEKLFFSYPVFFGDDVTRDKEFWERALIVFEKMKTSEQQFDYLKNQHNFVPAATSFIHRSIFFETIGFYEEFLLFIEDYPYWLKCTKQGFNLRILNEKLVKYRISTNSTSTSSIFQSSYLVFQYRDIKEYKLLKPLLLRINQRKKNDWYLNKILFFCIKHLGRILYGK